MLGGSQFYLPVFNLRFYPVMTLSWHCGGEGKESNAEQDQMPEGTPKYSLSCKGRVRSGWGHSSWHLLGKLVPVLAPSSFLEELSSYYLS